MSKHLVLTSMMLGAVLGSTSLLSCAVASTFPDAEDHARTT